MLNSVVASPALKYRFPMVLNMPEEPLFDVDMIQKDFEVITRSVALEGNTGSTRSKSTGSFCHKNDPGVQRTVGGTQDSGLICEAGT